MADDQQIPSCHYCDNPAEAECPTCGRLYCSEHGEDVCLRCMSPESAAPSQAVYRGSILIADEVKEDAKRAIAELKEAGVRQTIMLTGDAKRIGERVSASSSVLAELG